MRGLFGAYDQLIWQTIPLVMAASGFYLMRRAGLFAIPQAGLLAVGAYTGGLLSIHHPMNVASYLVAGAVTGTVVGAALGFVLARLDGIQLAIATVAFNAIIGLYVNNSSYMGGADGLTGITLYTPEWLILASFIVLLLGLWRLQYTQIGLAMDAIRGSAPLAATTGINVAFYRVGVFAGCGLICGAAGSLLAGYVGFIDPAVFSFDGEVQLLSMCVLGGMMTVLGPAIGALIVVGGPQVLTSLAEYRYVFQGVLIVLVIGLFPDGLAGIPGAVRKAVDKRRGAGSYARTDSLIDAAVATEVIAEEAAPTRSAAQRIERSNSAPPVLRVEGVSKQFGGLAALTNVDLQLNRAEILGIIGPNGSGKTTFLNIISGVLRPSAGRMWIDESDVTRRFGSPSRLARAGMARTFQGVQLLPDLTVLQNVCLGGYIGQSWVSSLGELIFVGRAGARKRAIRADALAMLDAAGLAEIANRSPGALPYGHQRIVEVIRPLIRKPRVLLLDEPSAGMTAVEKADLMHLLERYRTEDLSVILVEHDIGLMTEHCDRLVVFDFGQVIASGLPHDVMSTEEVLSAYVGPSTTRQ